MFLRVLSGAFPALSVTNQTLVAESLNHKGFQE